MQVLAQAVGRGLDASGVSVEELLRKVMGVTPVRHVASIYLQVAHIETTNNHEPEQMGRSTASQLHCERAV